MTAIPDRRSDSDADDVPLPWDQRPIVGDRRGLPWWGAVLLAFGLAVVGAVIDMQTRHSLGWLFQGAYFIGAVAAVCAVQRRSLFGPMVQPPLILGITVPGVVLLVSGMPENSDMLSKALAIGTPLINGFPTMAVTTGCTLVLGIVRIYRERNPDLTAKSGDSKRPTAPKRPGGAGRSGAESRGRRPAADRTGGGEDRAGAAKEGRTGGGAAAAGRASSGRRPGRRLPPDDDPRRAAATPRRGRADGDSGGRRAGEDEPRRDPAARGGKTPPVGRRPRQRGVPPEEDDRRGGEPRSGGAANRARRVPPRAGDPLQEPRRAPQGRRGIPPRRRPWDDDA
ncbi:DUF6542 domain-containing protein [Amycolatopsis viridis]|uniref:DUF6542 domain-containing protein n=1 Tax=Amycolatopsis viridis TaxID=185678 RepID=A0ABX0STE4_9PSEU|nr:DUF6542 domain-containing protein [Amycolatopsis viridis]NIH78650.1 hypothetical protein [Amycolatopsis viridis]